MNLGKFLVSYLIGCDYGIDKFYFVVHFFYLLISPKGVSASYTYFFTCNKILVIKQEFLMCKILLKTLFRHFQFFICR